MIFFPRLVKRSRRTLKLPRKRKRTKFLILLTKRYDEGRSCGSAASTEFSSRWSVGGGCVF